jgi:hypothetical protein
MAFTTNMHFTEVKRALPPLRSFAMLYNKVEVREHMGNVYLSTELKTKLRDFEVMGAVENVMKYPPRHGGPGRAADGSHVFKSEYQISREDQPFNVYLEAQSDQINGNRVKIDIESTTKSQKSTLEEKVLFGEILMRELLISIHSTKPTKPEKFYQRWLRRLMQ